MVSDIFDCFPPFRRYNIMLWHVYACECQWNTQNHLIVTLSQQRQLLNESGGIDEDLQIRHSMWSIHKERKQQASITNYKSLTDLTEQIVWHRVRTRLHFVRQSRESEHCCLLLVAHALMQCQLSAHISKTITAIMEHSHVYARCVYNVHCAGSFVWRELQIQNNLRNKIDMRVAPTMDHTIQLKWISSRLRMKTTHHPRAQQNPYRQVECSANEKSDAQLPEEKEQWPNEMKRKKTIREMRWQPKQAPDREQRKMETFVWLHFVWVQRRARLCIPSRTIHTEWNKLITFWTQHNDSIKMKNIAFNLAHAFFFATSFLVLIYYYVCVCVCVICLTPSLSFVGEATNIKVNNYPKWLRNEWKTM